MVSEEVVVAEVGAEVVAASLNSRAKKSPLVTMTESPVLWHVHACVLVCVMSVYHCL